MSADDSAVTILAYKYVIMIIYMSVLAIFYWQVPSVKSLGFIFLSALSGAIFHLCINNAYRLVDVTMTQPYTFLGLIFSGIAGLPLSKSSIINCFSLKLISTLILSPVG